MGATWDWDSLTCFSDIGGSISINKFIYHNITCKTTTVVVFKMSYTYIPESRLLVLTHLCHFYTFLKYLHEF